MLAQTIVADTHLKEIVNRLITEFDPDRIYLFGSRARGDYRGDSDYDLAVVVNDSSELPHRRDQSAYRALGDLPVAVDVLVWTRAEFDDRLRVPSSVPAAIVREGVAVYGDWRPYHRH